MGFFAWLLGRKKRDLFAEAEAYQARNEACMEKALRKPVVRQMLARLSVSDKELRSLHQRLLALGVDPAKCAKAIQNPQLIEWYFQHVQPGEQPSRDLLIELMAWANTGRMPTYFT